MKRLRAALARLGFKTSRTDEGTSVDAGIALPLRSGVPTLSEDGLYRESRSIDASVTTLRAFGAFELTIRRGDAASLTVIGPDATMMREIRTSITGRELTIRQEGSGFAFGASSNARNDATVVVHGPVVIKNMTMNFGDGDDDFTMTSDPAILGGRGLRVELVLPSVPACLVSGAVSVRLQDVRQDRVAVDLAGGSALDASGEAGRAVFNLQGAGRIDALDLDARHVELDIAGAATADLRASAIFMADIRGACTVNVYGQPKQRDVRSAGLGRVNFR